MLFLDEPTTGCRRRIQKRILGNVETLKVAGNHNSRLHTLYGWGLTLRQNRTDTKWIYSFHQHTSSRHFCIRRKKLFGIKSEMMYTLQQDLRSSSVVKSCNAFGEFYHLTLKDTSDDASSALLRSLKEKDISLSNLKRSLPKIEDCFIKLMSEGSN